MTSGKVLIVDDDAEIRGVLTDYLGSHDYEARAVDSGAAMRRPSRPSCRTWCCSISRFPARTACRSPAICASATASESS